MNKKSNEWKIVIKDLKNIRKLPIEIWKYILDISNIHYMPWKYSILENHVSIKKHLSTYVWRNVYNCVTQLYTVNVFTQKSKSKVKPYASHYNEENHDFEVFFQNRDFPNETKDGDIEWLNISDKKLEKIVSNKNMPEYIMTDVTSNQKLF